MNQYWTCYAGQELNVIEGARLFLLHKGALALKNQLVDRNISMGITANTKGIKAIASIASMKFLPLVPVHLPSYM